MATRAIRNRLERASEGSGVRFGENLPIQKNVESVGRNPARSPGESNANRLGPDLFEDIDRASPRDIERIRRAMALRDGADEEALSNRERFGRRQTKAAGVRAGARSLGRLGYLGGAAGLGVKTGAKLVELDEAAERGRERRRLQDEQESEIAKVPEADMPRKEDVVGMAKGGKAKAYAKGGKVRGGGCETKGKTKGRFV